MSNVRKKPRTILLVALAAWLLVVAVSAGLWFSRGPGSTDGVHVGLATPREAVTTFLNCLGAGHADDVLACVVNRPDDQRLGLGLADAVEGGLAPGDITLLPAGEAAALSEATLEESGGAATLTLPSRPDGEARRFVLERAADGNWRVDLLASTGLTPEQAEAFLDRLRAATGG